ncbi:hypothetical protein OROGR_013356 [Orobanche gracilis]
MTQSSQEELLATLLEQQKIDRDDPLIEDNDDEDDAEGRTMDKKIQAVGQSKAVVRRRVRRQC